MIERTGKPGLETGWSRVGRQDGQDGDAQVELPFELPRRWYVPRYSTVALALMAIVLAACDGPGVASPVNRTPVIARVGGSATSSAIVGTWNRTTLFVDEVNTARSTETTWQFGSDGTASRDIVSRDLTIGLVEVQTASGRWRVEGSTLIVDFLTPSAFQVRLAMQLTGDQLTLGGETFVRVLP